MAEITPTARTPEKAKVSFVDGRLTVEYRDEASLRSGLAVLASANGWLVQEEVVVPGWGRIDLVLRDDPLSYAFLVELKVDLSKPSAIRRAFQQADGYGRWWISEKQEPCQALLVAAKYHGSAISRVASAYPEVAWYPATDFSYFLERDGDRVRRGLRASSRLEALRQLVAVYEHAALRIRPFESGTDGLETRSTSVDGALMTGSLSPGGATSGTGPADVVGFDGPGAVPPGGVS